MKHYGFLDIIRAIAILGVVLVHLANIPGLNPPHWFEIGKIGVPLFFMLSAYTLCLSQSARTESSRGAFFLRRFFRIYPLFLLLIGYTFLLENLDVWYGLAKFDHYNRQSYLSKLTMTFGFFPEYSNNFFLGEWTLANEIIFYALFPLLYPFLKGSWKRSLGVFLLSIAIFYGRHHVWTSYKQNFAHLPGYIYDYEYYAFFSHAIDFAAGFLLFHLHQIFYTIDWKFRQKSLLGTVVLGCIGYFAYLRAYDIQLVHRQVVVVLIGFCVWMMQIRTVFTGFLNSVLQYIAKVSYSIYLVNLPIFVLIYHYGKYLLVWQKVMVFFIALFGVTWLTYQWEQWGVKVGKRVILWMKS